MLLYVRRHRSKQVKLMKHKRVAASATTAIILILSSPVWAGLIASTDIQNVGQVKGVGLTADPSTLDWGKLAPDDSKTLTVTLTSTSNVNVILNMTTQNLPAYLSLSWNREAYPLALGDSILASFTLTSTAAPQMATFNFDIIIWGTET